MSPRILLIVLAAFTLVRWTWNAPHSISPDEAYLALCGAVPAPAYFDGPPGTPVCVAIGTHFAGVCGLGAALLWPVFAFVASVAMFYLVTPLAGQRAAVSLALLLNLLPAFNHAALVPGAAMPVVMFSLCFLACSWRAVDNGSVLWWVSAGGCAAGGLLFGYAAGFLIPALALALAASRRWRRQILAPGFWIAAAMPSLVFGILLAWNSSHGWIHFICGTWQTALHLDWSRIPQGVKLAAGQVSPLVLVALACGFAFGIPMVRFSPKAKFIFIPAALAAAIAAYRMLTGGLCEDAGLIATVLALPLLSWLPSAGDEAPQFRSLTSPLRPALRIAALFPRSPLFLPAVFLTAAIWTAAPLLGGGARTRALVNADVVREIEFLRQSAGSGMSAFLIAQNAPLASAISLHLRDQAHVPPGHPPVYVVESPFADSQYALWPRYDQFTDAPPLPLQTESDPFTEQEGANQFIGRTALYISTESPDQLPQAIVAAFGSHRLLAEITAASGQTLRVYLCSDYQTLPL